MPKARRLTGRQVIAIFEGFGFQVVRVRGSHHQLRRLVGSERQNLTVPVHGNQLVTIGTLKSIYRQARKYIAQEDLDEHFYVD
jgi:predicted RNA binding protein YcfA (HicA-like mRNA interferase family)